METFTPKGHIAGPVLPAFVLRENISPGAKLLYSLLCGHAFDKDHCWPSHRLLAQELGYSVSSIKNWLGELVRVRLLSIRNEAYRSSTYILLRPQIPAAPTASTFPIRRGANIGYPQSNFGYRKESRENLEIYSPLPPKSCATPSRAPHTHAKRGGGDFIPANSAFEHFWSVYPRKEAKELARSAWHRLWRHGEIPALETLLTALERFRTSASWCKEHGRFVPQLVNWLRGRRWQDEAPEAPAPTESASDMTPERTEQVRRCMKRLANMQRPDPALEVARPVFEAFLSGFADGQRKRGPAWGLWSLLHSQGKAPNPLQVAHSPGGVMEFLKSCQYQS